MSRARLLRCADARPDARHLVACFPYAGGGPHAFRGWARALPEAEVWCALLPGHPGRLSEALATDLRELGRAAASEVAERVAQTSAAPILLGHSMGAWLALECARALESRGLRVAALVVAGRSGPGEPPDGPPIGQLPDDAFARELAARYGGLPGEALASAEIMELFLPILRADIAMLERYDPGTEKVSAPIHAWGGEHDATAPRRALEAWQRLGRNGCTPRLFPGGHFFLDGAREQVLAELRALIRGRAGAVESGGIRAVSGGVRAASDAAPDAITGR